MASLGAVKRAACRSAEKYPRDKIYCGKRAGEYLRQMLHAWKLAFRHPRSGDEMSFEAPVPSDFAKAMRQLPSSQGISYLPLP